MFIAKRQLFLPNQLKRKKSGHLSNRDASYWSQVAIYVRSDQVIKPNLPLEKKASLLFEKLFRTLGGCYSHTMITIAKNWDYFIQDAPMQWSFRVILNGSNSVKLVWWLTSLINVKCERYFKRENLRSKNNCLGKQKDFCQFSNSFHIFSAYTLSDPRKCVWK